MARIIQNKYPIDLDKRRAVGFGFPLNGDAVFVPTYTTRDQIKANLVSYLLTNKGERVFNPDYGADLRNLLFQSPTNSSFEELQFTIEDSIKNRFPQIKIKEINFVDNADQNGIVFTLTYEIVLFGVEDDIEIILQ